MVKELDGFVDDILVLYGFNIGGWMVRFLGKCNILWVILGNFHLSVSSTYFQWYPCL